jgi:ubiquinone/menaquinone biosynthesis C-methylase UbiE
MLIIAIFYDTIPQAFHWCPDYDAASKEFARILKPNGIVALIWNLEDRYSFDMLSSPPRNAY